jgi:hypothetical protein
MRFANSLAFFIGSSEKVPHVIWQKIARMFDNSEHFTYTEVPLDGDFHEKIARSLSKQTESRIQGLCARTPQRGQGGGINVTQSGLALPPLCSLVAVPTHGGFSMPGRRQAKRYVVS